MPNMPVLKSLFTKRTLELLTHTPQQLAYLQFGWQSVVLFLILILRAVCVVKV